LPLVAFCEERWMNLKPWSQKQEKKKKKKKNPFYAFTWMCNNDALLVNKTNQAERKLTNNTKELFSFFLSLWRREDKDGRKEELTKKVMNMHVVFIIS